MENKKQSSQTSGTIPSQSNISTLMTKEGWQEGAQMIRDVFPQVPDGFFRVLLKMLTEEKFTDDRFIRSVKNAIKTSDYPPTVAKIVSFESGQEYQDRKKPEIVEPTEEEIRKQEKEVMDFLDRWEESEKKNNQGEL